METNKSDKEVMLETIVDSLFRCIRDGIELNYESWLVWQSVARGVIAFSLPGRVKEIDKPETSIPLFQKKLERLKRMDVKDVFSGALETIEIFNSL